ncbi:hypothetical protein KUTeg_012872 [Tegillarca granosa]|uniref:Uncharacterized protein n=1 Tax=Tegillarca granosa TaxID=220873 RepID=A0ABQ9ES09_TEGGR|nr:hypothetical protein KUTeg_012872 [Tegillarca granosa]
MSTHTELPHVNNAVERLYELADRMRGVDFGFTNNDVLNIDRVIDAIYELDKERLRQHEKLETETIHASILRHKLQLLPAQIKEEIKGAIDSARQSNATALNNLQGNLDGINKNIDYLDDRQKELEKENAKLHPENELVREQHELIISQLNQRMAEKASMQIILNETRDKVRQTNQNIVDLEDNILQLKEDLIQERTEARVERKKLKKAVTDTTGMTKSQKEQNIIKKRELDEIHEQLMDSEGKLEGLRKSLRRYETSKAKLEGQERALSTQLTKQLKQNEELRKKGAQIINEDLKLQKEFEDNEKQLSKKLRKLDSETIKETARLKELEGQKLELHVDLEEKMKVRHLQHEKRQLALKAEEVGRMQAENVEMQEQIEELDESHKAVKAQLNKQVEDFREQLAKERKEREETEAEHSSEEEDDDEAPSELPMMVHGLEVQERKNSTSKEVEDYKYENQAYLNNMNKEIQEGKKEHIDLSNEGLETESDSEDEERGAQLQREMKKEEETVQTMKDELEKAQKDYENMFSAMQYKLTNMEREIIEMEHAIVSKRQEIEDKTPGFQELEAKFEKRTEDYNQMKKSIAGRRQYKSKLEDTINKTGREKDNMKKPTDQLKLDLKNKREENISQLKRHGEERKEIEREIYLSATKLKTIMEENNKLEQGCKKLEESIVDLNTQVEENEKMKSKLLDKLENTKDDLMNSWFDDYQMQQDFANRDELVVRDFGDLLDKTEERGKKISSITHRLEDELVMLAEFLDNLSTRRPRDTPVSGRSTRTSHRILDGRLSRLSQKSYHDKEQTTLGSARSSHKSRPATRNELKSPFPKSVTIIED